MITVIMPQVGQDIPSAEIIEWRKAEGERVEEGEVVVVVESEKAAFEVEAERAGVVRKILHGEGEEVEVFAPIAYIGEPDEPLPETEQERPQESLVTESVTEHGSGAAEGGEEAAGRPVASPSARRVARERGVDLSEVHGTGPGGRIIRRDVPAPERAGGFLPFGKVRRVAAQRLTRSVRTIPHFYVSADADLTETEQWRRAHNEAGGVHLTVTDLVIKAAALALREFERLNAHVSEDGLTVMERVNIGVAVATDDGLLVPVIPDADQKILDEISRFSKENAEAARRGALTSGATGSFTVSSLGMWGVREFLPIINPPECGILAAGAARERVVPTGDGIGVRLMMTLTLGCDHRAVDGAEAARFLGRVVECLENVETLEVEP
ncbi:MAG: dihydrolipoamide acetyltransferase family protein [Candidatus Brocadiia bacterium]